MLSGSIISTFTILKGKEPQVVWLYQGITNVPAPSVSHLKMTCSINTLKQKGIQAANTQLPYVLGNWGNSRGGNMLWRPPFFKSKQDEHIVIGLSVCIQDKVVETLIQNFTKENVKGIVINLNQHQTIEV